MESRDWILTLPRGADNVHDNLCLHNSRKRVANDEEDSGYASSEPRDVARGQKKARKVDMTEGAFKNRYILKDLVNARGTSGRD